MSIIVPMIFIVLYITNSSKTLSHLKVVGKEKLGSYEARSDPELSAY